MRGRSSRVCGDLPMGAWRTSSLPATSPGPRGCRVSSRCGGAVELWTVRGRDRHRLPEVRSLRRSRRDRSGIGAGSCRCPSAAIRDEGTSHHYLPAGREISADPDAVATAVAVLEERAVPHVVGKTWTTDAPYRETRSKIQARRAEGCATVEMETAAFLAVTQHRGVRFVQYLYAGDDVSGDTWDHRHWQTSSARRDLFWLSVEAVLRL